MMTNRIAIDAEIEYDDEREMYVIHFGGIGRPVVSSANRQVLVDFLEYLKTRTAGDALSPVAAGQAALSTDSHDLAGGLNHTEDCK
jgi:hypothetical protein